MTRLRVGLVGAGRRGQAHLSTILGIPDLYELTAVCDPADFNARATAARFSGPIYADVGEFFARERLDAVVIATPPESHHVMAHAAAERGVHMLIESPLAPTRAMIDYIAEVAAKGGVKVEVGENYWRHPVEQLNRRALDAGLIGDLLRVTCFYELGGNREMCYHAMSLARFYAGAGSAGAEIRAFEDRRPVQLGLDDSGRPYNPEIWSLALVTFPNGVRFSNTQVSTGPSPLRRSHPRAMSIEGTAGLIVAGRGAPNALHRVESGAEVRYPLVVDLDGEGKGATPRRYHYDSSPPIEVRNPFGDWPLGYGEHTFGVEDDIARARELAALHRAVAGGEPEYGIADARQDQEMSIAVNEAARTGDSVYLPLGPETPWERAQHEDFYARWERDPFREADELVSQSFGARGAG